MQIIPYDSRSIAIDVRGCTLAGYTLDGIGEVFLRDMQLCGIIADLPFRFRRPASIRLKNWRVTYAGEKADSDWQTDRFFQALPGKDKKVFTIPGASHIDLYDKAEYVDSAVAELATFFRRTLNAVSSHE